MKKILLVDLDSKIPNLALMKISTHYKNQGHDVTLWRFGFSGYKNERKGRKTIDASKYDKVFISIIFKCNKDVIKVINCDNVEYGGSGFDIKKTLPVEIERCEPDYSIYPDNNTSYGFITRGCIRKCSFCIVPKKEGGIHKVCDIDQIIKHDKVVFLDNNILAYPDHKIILKRLVEKQIRCSFTQGLDIRLLDPDNARLLSVLRYYPNTYTFAIDGIAQLIVAEDKRHLLHEFFKPWKVRFFIYCNADMNIVNNVIIRLKWCKDNKFLPYLMRDENCFSGINKGFYANLAAWCNRPKYFKYMTFEQFLIVRTSSIKTRSYQNNIFKGTK